MTSDSIWGTGEIGIGLSLGLCFGISIGVALDSSAKKERENSFGATRRPQAEITLEVKDYEKLSGYVLYRCID